jgi:hypothetical protein
MFRCELPTETSLLSISANESNCTVLDVTTMQMIRLSVREVGPNLHSPQKHGNKTLEKAKSATNHLALVTRISRTKSVKISKWPICPMFHFEVLTECYSFRVQSNSPLLRLPAELRNVIYEYVLGGHHIHSPPHWYKSLHAHCGLSLRSHFHYPRSLPAFPLTCVQLYLEVRLLPFRLVGFLRHSCLRFPAPSIVRK